MRRLAQTFIVLAFPLALGAQDAPGAGMWGVESSGLSGGSVIRFKSDSRARVVGLSGNFSRDADFGAGDAYSFAINVGGRRYFRVDQATRPFRTLSLTASYSSLITSKRTSVGVSAELGVAHFFSRHVSLGASTNLSGTLNRTEFTAFSTNTKRDGFGISLSSTRLVAAAYF